MTDELDRLALMLWSHPMTAKEICARMKCCKPTAYARIEALRKRGEKVFQIVRRSNKSGPAPYAYGIR